MSHVWINGIKGGGLVEGVGPTACGNPGSRFQNGTGGNFCILRTSDVDTVHCILFYDTVCIFLLWWVKISHVKELQHLHLSLGLLA